MYGRRKSPDDWDDSSSERSGSGAKWAKDWRWSSSQDRQGSWTPRGGRAESWDYGRNAAEVYGEWSRNDLYNESLAKPDRPFNFFEVQAESISTSIRDEF